MSPATKVLTIGAVCIAVALALGLKNAARSVASDPNTGFNRDTTPSAEPVPASYEPSVPRIPRLAALGAGACIPCKAMAPIRAELRREYAGVLAVDFYDVWKDPAAGKHFGILGIPTLIAYDASGRELGRLQGFASKTEILTNLARWGIVLPPPKG